MNVREYGCDAQTWYNNQHAMIVLLHNSSSCILAATTPALDIFLFHSFFLFSSFILFLFLSLLRVLIHLLWPRPLTPQQLQLQLMLVIKLWMNKEMIIARYHCTLSTIMDLTLVTYLCRCYSLAICPSNWLEMHWFSSVKVLAKCKCLIQVDIIMGWLINQPF